MSTFACAYCFNHIQQCQSHHPFRTSKLLYPFMTVLLVHVHDDVITLQSILLYYRPSAIIASSPRDTQEDMDTDESTTPTKYAFVILSHDQRHATSPIH